MVRYQDISVVRIDDVSFARLYNVSSKSEIKKIKNVIVVCLHHVPELRFREVLLVGLY